jgi:hypothetical protein
MPVKVIPPFQPLSHALAVDLPEPGGDTHDPLRLSCSAADIRRKNANVGIRTPEVASQENPPVDRHNEE